MIAVAKLTTLALFTVLLTTQGCARNQHRGPELQTKLGSEDQSKNPVWYCPESFGDGSKFGVKPVYFDYDSYALRTDALSTLNHNAAIFTKHVPGNTIQVEGHCDERGTQEYNLALGEQRALAVRHHLVNLGIDGARITTISYGEERPADSGQTENAYALNRRCEFAAQVF